MEGADKPTGDQFAPDVILVEKHMYQGSLVYYIAKKKFFYIRLTGSRIIPPRWG